MSEPPTIYELIYWVSAGPILTILVAIGLWQLKITKDTARMAAKRESFNLAANQCSHYLSHIIPQQNRLTRAIHDNNLKFFELAELIVKDDRLSTKYAGTAKDMIAVKDTVLTELLEVYNSMEAFSLFFIKGVADERVAFSSVGQTFCQSTREFFTYHVMYDSGLYCQNLAQLFVLWNSRIEAAELRSRKKSIDDELESLDTRTLDPLGTK